LTEAIEAGNDMPSWLFKQKLQNAKSNPQALSPPLFQQQVTKCCLQQDVETIDLASDVNTASDSWAPQRV
jgi:hypothetical protein